MENVLRKAGPTGMGAKQTSSRLMSNGGFIVSLISGRTGPSTHQAITGWPGLVGKLTYNRDVIDLRHVVLSGWPEAGNWIEACE